MVLGGQMFEFVDIYDINKMIPNCTVVPKNKILKVGTKKTSHGEGKLYLGSEKDVFSFFGEEGFSIKCFILKEDLLSYLAEVKDEYEKPTQNYSAGNELKDLWLSRMCLVGDSENIIQFSLTHQKQLTHAGVYVNSKDNGYRILRTICLPLISYLRFMKVKDETGNTLYYVKLFADFDAVWQRKTLPNIFTYGLKKIQKQNKKKKLKAENRNARDGQGKFRDLLIEEFSSCPITKISDERLLIASHIKPWSVSNETEQIDPNNGLLLSPLFDKLFDGGFITFTDDMKLVKSKWISPKNWERIGLKDDQYFQDLRLNESRRIYMEFHRHYIFENVRPWLIKEKTTK